MNSKRHVRNRLLDICPEVYLSKLLSLVNPIFVIQCHSWNTWALGFIQADLARLNRTFFTCLCLLWDTKLESKQKSIPTFGLCDFTAEKLWFPFWKKHSSYSMTSKERRPPAAVAAICRRRRSKGAPQGSKGTRRGGRAFQKPVWPNWISGSEYEFSRVVNWWK